MAREGVQQPGDESRSGGCGAKVVKVEKVEKVDKVEKAEKLIACRGQAATSWPYDGKHNKRSQRCLFRSKM